MAKERIPKTIYFIRSIQATAEEAAEIESLQPGVVIRSAMRSHPGEAIEPFDRVAGSVPEHYAKSDGKPREFLTKRAKKLARIEAELGSADKPADRPAKAPPKRRGAAKPMAVPGAPETGAGAAAGPQGAAWGASPAAAAPQPTPPATPPVWKPNA